MAKSKSKPTLVAFPPKPAAEPDQTAIEMVEEFLAAVKAGKIPTPNSVLIFYMEPTPDGGEIPGYWHKNTLNERIIAFGALIQEWGIRRWRGQDIGEVVKL